MRLKNKNAVISGGSNGIGKAIAMEFAKEGANIVISYYSGKNEADRIINEIKNRFPGIKIAAFSMDITKKEDRDKFVSDAVNFLGQIDILVNSTGICPRNHFLKATEEDFNEAVSVNYRGPYFLTQSICQKMIERGKGGSIINISSSRDRGGMPNLSIYASTKAALTVFSNSAALDLSQDRIRFNIISPGLTKTNMHKSTWQERPDAWKKRIQEIPLGFVAQPEDIALAAVYYASDESRYTTGSELVIDGGRNLKIFSNAKL